MSKCRYCTLELTQGPFIDGMHLGCKIIVERKRELERLFALSLTPGKKASIGAMAVMMGRTEKYASELACHWWVSGYLSHSTETIESFLESKGKDNADTRPT